MESRRSSKRRFKEEELPPTAQVYRNSPKKKKSLDFEMPDARVIIAERKKNADLERKFEIIVKENSPSHKNSNSGMESVNNSDLSESHTIHENKMIKFRKLFDSEPENSQVRSENPGFDSKEIDFNNIDLPAENKNSLKSLLERFHSLNEHAIEENLNSLLTEMEKQYSRNGIELTLGYIKTSVLFLLIVAVDKKLRLKIKCDIWQLLHLFFRKIPIESDSSHLISSMTSNILAIFSHFHDRVYVADYFQTLNTHLYKSGRNICNKIAESIFLHTLFGILDCEYDKKTAAFFSLRVLKSFMCKKIKKEFSLYEHYIFIQILDFLRNYFNVDEKYREKEKCAQDWFLKEFNKNMLCSQSTDVHKIKMQSAQMEYLWKL